MKLRNSFYKTFSLKLLRTGHKRLAKAVVSLSLAAFLTVTGVSGPVIEASAKTSSQLAKEQKEKEKEASKLSKKKQKAQAEVDKLQSQLVDMLSEIEALQSEISDNKQDISDTKAELKEAEAAEQQQYESMKKRIRYFYENNDSQNIFTILIESGSITDFINRIGYMNSVYSYDRNLLDSYEATRVEIEGMKEDLESQRVELKKEKKSLKAKKASLNSLIDSKQDEVDDIDAQVKIARAAASKLAVEKKQALDAEKAAAAEEAARQAAAAEAAAQAAAAQQSSSSNSSSSNSTSSGSSNSSTTADADPAPATNVSGSSVVSYAEQFVGNPYVWGGDSLANGCDCSGFVVQVYKHFGINLSGSRNSAALRYVGSAVSPDNIQPGDIVCYSGHVAIYAGGGRIVEAQSSRAGITDNRTYNHTTILAIRRVV